MKDESEIKFTLLGVSCSLIEISKFYFLSRIWKIGIRIILRKMSRNMLRKEERAHG